MAMLLHFTAQTELLGAHVHTASLGHGDLALVAAGAGLQGRMPACCTLSGGCRGRTPLPSQFGNGGPARRSQTGLVQQLLGRSIRGALPTRWQQTPGKRSPVLMGMWRGGQPVRGYQVQMDRFSIRGERGWQLLTASSLPALLMPPMSGVLLLDDVEVSEAVQSLRVRSHLDDAHRLITLEGVSPTLIPSLERAKALRAPVLTLQMDEVRWAFVVEDLKLQDGGIASGSSVQVEGRGETVLRDAPFAPPVHLEPGAAPRSAKETAASLLAPAALHWEGEDFLLPPELPISGTPVGIAQAIAAAAGRILQPGGAGGFAIRPRFSQSPKTLPHASPAFLARDDETLLDVTSEVLPGLPYGGVRVQGHVQAADLPLLEAEVLTPREATVLVTWQGGPVQVARSVQVRPWVSDGTVQPLGDMERIIEERLTFEQGQAMASRPVWRLDGPVRWLGKVGGPVRVTPASTILTLESPRHGLAHVRYVTQSQAYRLHDVQAEDVLFVLHMEHRGAVAATVRSSLLEGLPLHPHWLEVPMAGSASAAIAAGEAFLLEHCLPTRRVRATIPAGVMSQPPQVGDVALVAVDAAALQQRMLLTGWTLQWQGQAKTYQLEGLTWRA